MCIKTLIVALSAVISLFIFDAATQQGLVVFEGFPLRQYYTHPRSSPPSYDQPTAGDFAATFFATKGFKTSNLTSPQPLFEPFVPRSQREAAETSNTPETFENPTYEPVSPSTGWKTLIFKIVLKFLHLENRVYWTFERIVWLFLLAAVTKLENDSCDIAHSHIIQVEERNLEVVREENTNLEEKIRRLNEDNMAMAAERDQALQNATHTNQRLSISEAHLAGARKQHADLVKQSTSIRTALETDLEEIKLKLETTEQKFMTTQQELGHLRDIEDKVCKAQEVSDRLEKELKSKLDVAKKQEEKMSKANSAKMQNLEKQIDEYQQVGKKTTQQLKSLTAEKEKADATVQRLNGEIAHYKQLKSEASKTTKAQAAEVAALLKQVQEGEKETKRLNDVIANHQAQQSSASTSAGIQAAEIAELKEKIRRAKEETDRLNQSIKIHQAREKEACKNADEKTLSNELLRGELNETRKMVLDFEAKYPVVLPSEAETNALVEELEGMKQALADSQAEEQVLQAEYNKNNPPRQDQFISPMEVTEAKSRVLNLKEEEVKKAAEKVAARQKELEERGITTLTAPVADEARAFRVNSYKLGFQNTMLKEAKVALMEAERELRAVNDGFVKRAENLGTDILHYKDALENHYRPALTKAGLPMPRRPVGSINPHLYGHNPPFGFQTVTHQPAHPASPAFHQQQYQQQYQRPPPPPAFPQPFSHQLPTLPRPPQQQHHHQLMPQAPEFRPQAPAFIPQAPDTTSSREQRGQPSRSQPRHQQSDGNNPGLVRKDW